MSPSSDLFEPAEAAPAGDTVRTLFDTYGPIPAAYVGAGGLSTAGFTLDSGFFVPKGSTFANHASIKHPVNFLSRLLCSFAHAVDAGLLSRERDLELLLEANARHADDPDTASAIYDVSAFLDAAAGIGLVRAHGDRHHLTDADGTRINFPLGGSWDPVGYDVTSVRTIAWDLAEAGEITIDDVAASLAAAGGGDSADQTRRAAGAVIRGGVLVGALELYRDGVWASASGWDEDEVAEVLARVLARRIPEWEPGHTVTVQEWATQHAVFGPLRVPRETGKRDPLLPAEEVDAKLAEAGLSYGDGFIHDMRFVTPYDEVAASPDSALRRACEKVWSAVKIHGPCTAGALDEKLPYASGPSSVKFTADEVLALLRDAGRMGRFANHWCLLVDGERVSTPAGTGDFLPTHSADTVAYARRCVRAELASAGESGLTVDDVAAHISRALQTRPHTYRYLLDAGSLIRELTDAGDIELSTAAGPGSWRWVAA